MTEKSLSWSIWSDIPPALYTWFVRWLFFSTCNVFWSWILFVNHVSKVIKVMFVACFTETLDDEIIWNKTEENWHELIRGRYRCCESCDFTVKLSNLHKIGKYGKEMEEKSAKLSTKLGKNWNFHIVSIEAASATVNGEMMDWIFFSGFLPWW